jgi:hypothetical protein
LDLFENMKGRQEDIYHLKNPDHGLFVIFIEGAFEVQNRLMEARDGLSLQNPGKLEFESLSNDAIILIIEVAECCWCGHHSFQGMKNLTQRL